MSLQKNQSGTLIDGVAANAAAASRTATVNVMTASSIGFDVSLSQSAATALTAILYKSADGGTNYARVKSISIAAGTGTATDYVISDSLGGEASLWVDLDVTNATHVKIIVAATGGGASDLITVRGCASSWS